MEPNTVQFTADEAAAIQRGAKCETRRPVRSSRGARVPCPVREGDSLPLTVDGATVGRIAVESVRSEPHGLIDYAGAIREGATSVTPATLDEYRAAYVERMEPEWCRIADGIIHGAGTPIRDVADELGVTDRVIANRVEQLLAAGALPDGVPLIVAASQRAARVHRFERVHAHREVWVVRFRLDRDTPRFCVDSDPFRVFVGDYSHSPTGGLLDDAGEALTEAEQIAVAAGASEVERLRREYEARLPIQRIGDAITELEAQPLLGATAARRLAGMRRELDRLNREMAA